MRFFTVVNENGTVNISVDNMSYFLINGNKFYVGLRNGSIEQFRGTKNFESVTKMLQDYGFLFYTIAKNGDQATSRDQIYINPNDITYYAGKDLTTTFGEDVIIPVACSGNMFAVITNSYESFQSDINSEVIN